MYHPLRGLLRDRMGIIGMTQYGDVLGLERFALWPLAALLISSGVSCIVRAARDQSDGFGDNLLCFSDELECLMDYSSPDYRHSAGGIHRAGKNLMTPAQYIHVIRYTIRIALPGATLSPIREALSSTKAVYCQL